MQALAPLLEQRSTLEDPARVLVTASIAGLIPGTLGKHATYGYAASKAAVIHLVKNLALDLGRQRRHVLVNAIAPGFFPSRMSNGLLELGGGAERMARAVPGGRLGRGEDFAAAVVWLGSRAGSHVDGAVIVLDGGASLGGGMGGGVEEEEGGAAQGAFRAKL